uniref:Uncharacterized protein n=1 Tax=Setaria italica TaxID=4555 RepID=K3Y0P3_SETIT
MAITRICSDQNHLVKGAIPPAATNPLVVHEGLSDSSYIYSHTVLDTCRSTEGLIYGSEQLLTTHT